VYAAFDATRSFTFVCFLVVTGFATLCDVCTAQFMRERGFNACVCMCVWGGVLFTHCHNCVMTGGRGEGGHQCHYCEARSQFSAEQKIICRLLTAVHQNVGSKPSRARQTDTVRLFHNNCNEMEFICLLYRFWGEWERGRVVLVASFISWYESYFFPLNISIIKLIWIFYVLVVMRLRFFIKFGVT